MRILKLPSFYQDGLGTVCKHRESTLTNGCCCFPETHSASFTASAVPPHGSVFIRLTPGVVSGAGVRHCAETQPPCSTITGKKKTTTDVSRPYLLHVEMINLPRQARDKHTRKALKTWLFLGHARPSQPGAITTYASRSISSCRRCGSTARQGR